MTPILTRKIDEQGRAAFNGSYHVNHRLRADRWRAAAAVLAGCIFGLMWLLVRGA